MKKKLPIGISTFKDIINDNFIYVDKTKFIFELILNFRYIFLSRPRRFGKSLLLDTIKSVFEGKKELFKGLYIYDKWNWEQKFPVIKIDFVGGNFIETQLLVNKLQNLLNNLYHYHEIDYTQKIDVVSDFQNLILALVEKYQQRVVILVDEYDKPILDCITNVPVATANREILKGFYSVIKASDEFVQFAFLTGVSKFTKTSIFSGLNNLHDITLEREFATICGYTHEDLLNYFQEYLQEVDLEEVKRWYNGYCWHTKEPKVYNPFDILKFLNNKEYKSYWFESGTPTFLIKLIQENDYYLPDLESITADSILLSTFDIQDLPIVSVLWQTGYLTIKDQFQHVGVNFYELYFPNFEVEYSFNQALLKSFVHTDFLLGNLTVNTWKALNNNNLNLLEKQIKTLFSGISYSYSQHVKNYEGFYGSVIYAFFKGLGLNCIIEDHTNVGRIDLTLKLKEKIYLFEFKMTHHKESALQQIKTKKYYEKYIQENKEMYLVGLIFDLEVKNLTVFEWEKM